MAEDSRDFYHSQNPELDLHGYSRDDLENAIDKFLNRCFMEGHTQVQIIHGKGLGIFQKDVMYYLKLHPLVEIFFKHPDKNQREGSFIVNLHPKE